MPILRIMHTPNTFHIPGNYHGVALKSSNYFINVQTVMCKFTYSPNRERVAHENVLERHDTLMFTIEHIMYNSTLHICCVLAGLESLSCGFTSTKWIDLWSINTMMYNLSCVVSRIMGKTTEYKSKVSPNNLLLDISAHSPKADAVGEA